MRRDMNKVLIERPRAGGNCKPRKKFEKISRSKRRFRDYDEDYDVEIDDSPRKVSMRKPHKVNGDEKYFTDLLGPLARFLRSRDGKRWDDVWSEICQVMKGNGLQAAHIKGHVKDYVGGIPHSGVKSYGYKREPWTPNSYDPVYVDPEGILRKNPEWDHKPWKARRRNNPTIYHYYRESDTVEYHKLNGAWFRVEISSETYEKFYKSLYGGSYKRSEVLYSIEDKRTISKKEAKLLDLDNRYEYIPPKLTLENKNEQKS